MVGDQQLRRGLARNDTLPPAQRHLLRNKRNLSLLLLKRGAQRIIDGTDRDAHPGHGKGGRAAEETGLRRSIGVWVMGGTGLTWIITC